MYHKHSHKDSIHGDNSFQAIYKHLIEQFKIPFHFNQPWIIKHPSNNSYVHSYTTILIFWRENSPSNSLCGCNILPNHRPLLNLYSSSTYIPHPSYAMLSTKESLRITHNIPHQSWAKPTLSWVYQATRHVITTLSTHYA